MSQFQYFFFFKIILDFFLNPIILLIGIQIDFGYVCFELPFSFDYLGVFGFLKFFYIKKIISTNSGE